MCTHSVCSHSNGQDLVQSHFRWYDVPALLLMYYPVRCRNCGERMFLPRNKQQHPLRHPMFRRLWPHYVIASLLLMVVGCASIQTASHLNARDADPRQPDRYAKPAAARVSAIEGLSQNPA